MSTPSPMRKSILGLAGVAGWAGITLGIPALERLFVMVDGRLGITLEPDPRYPRDIDLGGGSVQLTDTITIRVPLDDLSGGAIGLLVIANALLVIGLLVSTLVICTGMNQATDPALDTASGARSMVRGFWLLAGTFAISGLAFMIGDRLAIGDLGVPEMNNGITITTIVAAIGVLGLVWFLRTLVSRAAAAEADTEGLV